MDYIKYVNIKQGTHSVPSFSKGNTLPLCQLPFGFSSVSPQTNGNRSAWFYCPTDYTFEGYRFTHQASPWMAERGAITTMPQIDIPHGRLGNEWSPYDPNTAILAPHYLKYDVKRSLCDFELTPTEFGAWLRVTFNSEYTKGIKKYISAIPVPGATYTYEYDTENERLFVKTDFDFWWKPQPEKVMVYYVFQFEKGTVNHDGIIVENIDEYNRKNEFKLEGKNTAVHIEVNCDVVNYKVSQSYISFEQALINLENDSKYDSFEALVEENAEIWNKYLGKVEIDEDEEKMKTFYSCMYRGLLYPHRAYEINKEGKAIHYAPALDKVVDGFRYTDNGFWDTYRTVYPFFAIVDQDICMEMTEAFIQDYIDGGWLPRWTTLGAKNCMPSTAIDVVIADLAVKGLLKGDLLRTAFEGMEKNANVVSEIPSYGREGIDDLNKYGYVPYDLHTESVNLTVDSSYHDYCISVVAGILGETEKQAKYLERSIRYRTLFDKETGFLRAKDSKGEFKPNFNPFAWAKEYTEASAWPTTFGAQHDLFGLAELMGGNDKLIKKLDDLFAAPPIFYVTNHERAVQEMAELCTDDWGQCAISNQPSFHIPFIYAYFGEQEKSDYWIKRMCEEGFSSDDLGGFPGDEDNGSAALWYVFAQMGLYPICPGKTEYTVTKPLVKEVKINGKKLDLTGYKRVITFEEIMKQVG